MDVMAAAHRAAGIAGGEVDDPCPLTHGRPELHRTRWPARGRSVLALDIETFVEELEAAWLCFYRTCFNDPTVRRRVVENADELLTFFEWPEELPEEPAGAAGTGTAVTA